MSRVWTTRRRKEDLVNDTTAGPLVERLPGPLPAAQIIALNQPKADLHSARGYVWNGWEFDVPPGVFLPGATSRMIHERVLDGRIEVRDRRYAAMGVGLGVEAVAAGVRGAREIHALDVHPESVASTKRHYERFVGDDRLIPLVSDVFEAVPDNVQFDVITFNPPAVSQSVSADPDVVRNVCVGAPLLADFFAQIARRDLLAPGGEVFVIASNTADLRDLVSNGVRSGFVPEVAYRHDWHDGVLTYLFRLLRGEAT